MSEYEILESETDVPRSKGQPDDDEDPTLTDHRGPRESDGEDVDRKRPPRPGGYTICLPGLRDIDWGW